MPVIGEHKIVVLWEHEVRAAAKALAGLEDDHSAMSKEEYSRLVVDALNASFAALRGAEDETAAITVSTAPDVRMLMKKHSKKKEK